MTQARAKDRVTPSSGNVFADLRLSNPEEKQTKVRLAYTINQIIEKRHFSRGAAARSLGINQPKISPLRNYQLDGFSVERLMKFLTALGCDIETVIRPKSKSRKTARVLVTADLDRVPLLRSSSMSGHGSCLVSRQSPVTLTR